MKIAIALSLLLLAGCASDGSSPPRPDPGPSPDEIVTAAAEALAAGESIESVSRWALPATAVTSAAGAAATAAPQLVADSGPNPDPFGSERRARIGIPTLRSAWTSDFVTAIEVRPPHLGWWLGWTLWDTSISAPTPEDSAFAISDVVTGTIYSPPAWGCYEARAKLHGVNVPDGQERQETVWSNVTLVGSCPNPLPPRVPLAAPESSGGTALAACLALLVFLGRREIT